jgi:hypothetical protein
LQASESSVGNDNENRADLKGYPPVRGALVSVGVFCHATELQRKRLP